jgi:hypothetical protein
MTEKTLYRLFTSWAELLDALSAEYRVFYQAPLDYGRHLVTPIVRQDGRLYVIAPYGDVDPFIADVAHLPRFSRLASRFMHEDN